jgi:hypothetical protein
MRVLVYAAGAYALCMGTAEAFAPPSAVGSAAPTCRGRDCGASGEQTPGLRMAWDASGYVPERLKNQQKVDPLVGGQSAMTAAASFEASYAAPAAVNPADSAKSWTPPSGYVPGGSGAFMRCSSPCPFPLSIIPSFAQPARQTVSPCLLLSSSLPFSLRVSCPPISLTSYFPRVHVLPPLQLPAQRMRLL